MSEGQNGAPVKPEAFRGGKRPLRWLKFYNGKAKKPGYKRPRRWRRFYTNTLAPLLNDPWSRLKYAVGGALLLGLGFCGAAIADYFISGALDMQAVGDIRAVYYNAASREAQEEETVTVFVHEEDPSDTLAYRAYLALKNINPDAVGWLKIPGTQIDYPVAQGKDNRYYLKHSFRKKKSGHACIFLDWRNQPGDLSFVVYGHDMKDRTYFGSLQDYHDEQFCREHPVIEMNFWGEATEWKIFSVRVTDDTAVPVMFESFDEYGRYLKGAAQGSEFDFGVEVDSNDTILTLSTCGAGNTRLLVQAVRVK